MSKRGLLVPVERYEAAATMEGVAELFGVTVSEMEEFHLSLVAALNAAQLAVQESDMRALMSLLVVDVDAGEVDLSSFGVVLVAALAGALKGGGGVHEFVSDVQRRIDAWIMGQVLMGGKS